MNLCYLCHHPLCYELNIANEYSLFCTNYECCGRIDKISFNYRVQDQEVIHYFLPLYYNNKLYSVLSSQRQLITNEACTIIEYYSNRILFNAQVLASVPKFYPAQEHNLSSHAFQMINRLMKIKSFS